MSFGPGSSQKPAEMTRWRHLVGFAGAGLLAFCVDAGVLAIGTRVLAFDALVVRLIGVALAMVVAWWCHRRWTFAVHSRASVREFGRFVGVAWVPSAVNYAVFGLTLHVWPQVWPQLALILATAIATIVSYVSLRYGVFRGPGGWVGKH